MANRIMAILAIAFAFVVTQLNADPIFTIDDGALTFIDLNGATEVTIPDEVTSISAGAVQYPHSFEISRITIPNSVTNIAGYAFSGCRNMTQVSIGSGVISIGESAFGGCISICEFYNSVR